MKNKEINYKIEKYKQNKIRKHKRKYKKINI